MTDEHPPYPEQGYEFKPDKSIPSPRGLKKLGNNIFLAGAKTCQAKDKAVDACKKAKQDAKEIIDEGREMAQTSGLTQHLKDKAKDKASDLKDKAKETASDLKDKAKDKIPSDIKAKATPIINQGRASASEFMEKGKEMARGIIELGNDEMERAKEFVQGCGIPLSQPPVTPGCLVQLVSASAGGAVQIVTRDGALTLDARGPLDTNAFNTLWRVVRGAEPDTVALHNHRNYITLAEDGLSSAVTNVKAAEAAPPREAALVLRQHCLVATLEYACAPGSFLGFSQQGELVPPGEAVSEHNNCLALRVVAANKGTDL